MKMSLKKEMFDRKNILVVGDVMLDKYWFGDSERISPEAPVPIVKMDRVDQRLGGAGNVALNIANLGVRTSLLAVVGNDEAGSCIRELLERGNITSLLESDSTVSTTVKLRVVARNQQLLRCDFESPLREESLIQHLNVYKKEINGADGIVFSDYAKGGLSHIALMIKEANRLGIPVFIDPKGSNYDKYENATVITPNKKELADVVGKWTNEEQLTEHAQNLRNSLNIKYLLLTRSEEGMTLFSDSGKLTIPTEAKEVYDVSGAGDTVIASLSAAFCAGFSIEDSIVFANVAAGIVVGKVGTAPVTFDEIQKSISSNRFA